MKFPLLAGPAGGALSRLMLILAGVCLSTSSLWAEDTRSPDLINTQNFLAFSAGRVSWLSSSVALAMDVPVSKLNNSVPGPTNPVYPPVEAYDNRTQGNAYDFMFGWATSGGFARGIVELNYWSGQTGDAIEATQSPGFILSTPLSNVTTDRYFSGKLQHGNLRYIQEFYVLSILKSRYLSGIGVRAGIDADVEGGKMEGSGTVTGTASTFSIITPRYILEKKFQEVAGLGIAGVIYRVVVMKGLELDATYDVTKGKSTGRVRSSSAAPFIFGTAVVPILPVDTSATYHTNINGARKGVGATYAFTETLALRVGWFQDQSIHGVTSTDSPTSIAGLTGALSGLNGTGASAIAALVGATITKGLGPYPTHNMNATGWTAQLQMRL